VDGGQRTDGLALAALALDGGRPGTPLALSEDLRRALDARLERLIAAPSRERAIAELAAAARPSTLSCAPHHPGAAALLAAHGRIAGRAPAFVPRRGYRPPEGLVDQLARWAEPSAIEERAALEARRAEERAWPA
jgi:hypothetical protein